MGSILNETAPDTESPVMVLSAKEVILSKQELLKPI